jgi:hypothetical protein
MHIQAGTACIQVSQTSMSWDQDVLFSISHKININNVNSSSLVLLGTFSFNVYLNEIQLS